MRGYDYLLINGPIMESLLYEIWHEVSQQKVNKKLVFALVTYGGSANVGYQIARYLQTMYDELVALVPTVCKSAGTLVVTGAHKLFITPFGEIGPLDVQLKQRDEIFGRRSGLNTRSAINDLTEHSFAMFEHYMVKIVERSQGAVTFKLASEIAAKVTAGLMAKVYEQINPEALGQDCRDLSVATEYCTRLNQKSGNLKTSAIERLVHGYPSHDFVIDLEEAREIFVNVDRPPRHLYDIMIKPRLADLIQPKQTSIVEMYDVHGRKGKAQAAPAEKANGNGQTASPRRDDRGATQSA